jgi:methionine biosynthesis protein MetW
MKKRTFYQLRYPKDFAKTSTHTKYIKACELLKSSRRVLDVGCADGDFLMMLKEKSSSISELYGIDISEEAVAEASRKGVHAYCLDVDIERFPFENEFFDAIFCGDVIEHLYDPDHLLDELYRVLKKNGVCILTTPNLASWYNRVFLLLGYQPVFTEVSLRHDVGHPFPFWSIAGHIRMFTLKALCQLVEIHGFKIIQKIGFGIDTHVEYGKRFKILAKIANKLFSNPSLASHIMLVMTK